MDELRPGTDDDASPSPGCSATSCSARRSRPQQAAKQPGIRRSDELHLLTHARHPAPARLRPRRARRGAARCSACRRDLLRGWQGVERRLGAGPDERRRRGCSSLAVLLVLLGGLFAGAEAALSRGLPGRAEELSSARAAAARPAGCRSRPTRPATSTCSPCSGSAARLLATVLVTLGRRSTRFDRLWQAVARRAGVDGRRVLRRGRRRRRGRSAASTPTAVALAAARLRPPAGRACSARCPSC